MKNSSSSSSSSNAAKRNYLIGLNNGVLVELNKSLINPNLVLAAFVYSKTGSALLVGLLTAFNHVGTFLPQLYVSSLTEYRKRKKPFIIKALLLRILIMISLVFLIWFSSHRDSLWIVYLFTLCFLVYRLFRGAEFIVFWDFFGTSLPSNRLGGFIAYRSLLSSIAAMLSGVLIVHPVLKTFPENKSFFLLSLFALVILLVDLFQMTLLKEIPNCNPPSKRNFVKTVSASAKYFKKSSNYRKIFIMRIFHRINMLTFAFLIPYAYEKLGITGMAGIFLSIIETSKFLSSVVWGKISDRSGNRAVLTAGNLLFFFSAGFVFLSSVSPVMFSIDIIFLENPFDLPMLIFLISLVFAGAAQAANGVSYKAFVIESAPEGRKSSSLAFINTITVPLALVAPAAGFLMETYSSGYSLFYLILSASGLVTAFAAFSLKEVRTIEKE